MKIAAQATGRISKSNVHLDRMGEPQIELSSDDGDLCLTADVQETLRLIKILSDAVVTAQALRPEVAA